MRRLIAPALVAAVLAVPLASPASAGGGAGGAADPDGAGASVGAAVPGGAAGGTGGSESTGGGNGGTGGGGGYRVDRFLVTDLATGTSVTACDVYSGSTFLVTRSPCDGGGGAGGSAPPRITGADVAQRALARFRLRTPSPAMWPEPNRLVVRLPVQLWLAGGWEPQSATASAGGLSATVTAQPQRVTWTMGDSGSVSCATAGRPASQGGGSNCSYTYKASSAGKPGDAYRVTVSVTFAASWSATDGMSGNLGPLTSPAGSVTVQVGEIQAVNTPAPGGGG